LVTRPTLLALGLLLLAGAARIWIFGVVEVRTASMLPTLTVGETWLYLRHGTIGLGDVVVLEVPGEEGVLHVKRVTGLSGDEVELAHGRFYLNGSMVGGAVEPLQWPGEGCRMEEWKPGLSGPWETTGRGALTPDTGARCPWKRCVGSSPSASGEDRIAAHDARTG
jgi:signal peptidase I